jgi:hypothetical protein
MYTKFIGIFLSLIVLSTLSVMNASPAVSSSVGSNYTTSILEYVLQPIWENTMENYYAWDISTFLDVDNDGVQDVLVYGGLSINYTYNDVITIISGNSSIIASLPLPYNYYPRAIDVAGDMNGDGYLELVVYYEYVDYDVNKTYVGFITWQPVGNITLANGTYVFDRLIYNSPWNRVVVEDGEAIAVVSYADLSGETPTFKTYWIYYNVSTGEITVNEQSNVYYDIYGNLYAGDIDDDGLIEMV